MNKETSTVLARIEKESRWEVIVGIVLMVSFYFCGVWHGFDAGKKAAEKNHCQQARKAE